jgi:hypothetical protein
MLLSPLPPTSPMLLRRSLSTPPRRPLRPWSCPLRRADKLHRPKSPSLRPRRPRARVAEPVRPLRWPGGASRGTGGGTSGRAEVVVDGVGRDGLRSLERAASRAETVFTPLGPYPPSQPLLALFRVSGRLPKLESNSSNSSNSLAGKSIERSLSSPSHRSPHLPPRDDRPRLPWCRYSHRRSTRSPSTTLNPFPTSPTNDTLRTPLRPKGRTRRRRQARAGPRTWILSCWPPRAQLGPSEYHSVTSRSGRRRLAIGKALG